MKLSEPHKNANRLPYYYTFFLSQKEKKIKEDKGGPKVIMRKASVDRDPRILYLICNSGPTQTK